ncbi:MAG: ribonuclease [Actinomycetota bacterium]
MSASTSTSRSPLRPTRDLETELRNTGRRTIVGVDEVGKGAWAGPLAVGVAIVPDADSGIHDVEVLIRDSKSISEKKRERMFDEVASWVDDWSVGMASPVECDRLGMSRAQRLATERALAGLATRPDSAIVDGSWDFVSPLVPHVTTVVKGDTRCLSVAAASILAKVTRDRLMRDLADQHPAYRFESNKGYPCAWHRAGLYALGPSAIHRRSWAFMDALGFWTGLDTVGRELT